MLKLLHPHTHAGLPYPAGYLLQPAAAGMSLADAESLVRQGRAIWVVDAPEEIPPATPENPPCPPLKKGGRGDLQRGETPPEPNLLSPEETQK